MNRRSITIVISIFVLIILGMFAFAYFQSQSLETVEEPMVEDTQEATPYDGIDRVEAKHFYMDGTHTLVGEIMMPTACDLVETEAVVGESMPEQVGIYFTVINTAEVCAQVVTPYRFRVDFDASEDATISAQLMGRSIELNLLPPAEGETPDDFELFIKG